MDLLKKLLTSRSGKQAEVSERRISPRYRLKQSAMLCTESKQTICVIVEDIAIGGVKFRSDSHLKEDENYLLKVKSADDRFLFGLKVVWRKKDRTGAKLYGGTFVGPGSHKSDKFKEFLAKFDWKPVFQPVLNNNTPA